MKTFFTAAIFSLFCFINLFYQIKCNDVNGECFNMDKFSGQEMKVVKSEMYRFRESGHLFYVAVGNEPFIFWLKLNRNIEMHARFLPAGISINNVVNIEIFGRSDCRVNFDGTKPIHFESKCFECPKSKRLYVPFKIWTDGGPVAFGDITQDDKLHEFYLPENVTETYHSELCKNGFMLSTFHEKDYTNLQSITSNLNNVFNKEDGKEYLSLINEYTVIFVEINDLSPEHFLLIELEDGKTSKNNVEFKIEANGHKPEIIKSEAISNGLNIKLRKDFCRQTDYKYVGFVRYIFHINVLHKFKATFYDSEEKNLKLKFWPAESNGKPKNTLRYNPEKFIIPPISAIRPSTTTTIDGIPSTLTTTTPTRTLFIPSTTVISSSSTESSKSTLSTTSNIFIPSATTTVSQNKIDFGNDTNNDDEIQESSFVPVLPNPSRITSKAENIKTSEEPEGMSLSILIPIIVGSLLGLLIIICIIVICIIRCYRSHQRKKNQLSYLETKSQAEEEIQKKRSIWKNIIIVLIGPDPKPSRNRKRQRIAPSSINHPKTPIPRSTSNTSLAPPTSNISKPPPPVPHSPALRLQRTQSIPKSSRSQTYSTTLKAAKMAKRDPRFPHLIPGTIEFIVAKQQCDYGTLDDDDGPKSGPRDESDIIQFLNPN